MTRKTIINLIAIIGGLSAFAYLFYIVGYNIGENKSPDRQCEETVISLNSRIDSLNYTPDIYELTGDEAISIIKGQVVVKCSNFWSYSADLDIIGCDGISLSGIDDFKSVSTISAEVGKRCLLKVKGDIFVMNFLKIDKSRIKIEVAKYRL